MYSKKRKFKRKKKKNEIAIFSSAGKTGMKIPFEKNLDFSYFPANEARREFFLYRDGVWKFSKTKPNLHRDHYTDHKIFYSNLTFSCKLQTETMERFLNIASVRIVSAVQCTILYKIWRNVSSFVFECATIFRLRRETIIQRTGEKRLPHRWGCSFSLIARTAIRN